MPIEIQSRNRPLPPPVAKLKQPKRPPKASAYDPSNPDPDIPHPIVASQFAVVVDTREQASYRFTSIIDDKTGLEIVVPLRHYALKSGDYSIAGLEDVVAVERKSLKDFYQSISSERERFEREIARLNESYRYALVVIEGDYEEIANPESFTSVAAKTAFRTIQSWEIRYPMVHWRWLPNRRVCEVWTYRQLEMFWRIWCHEQEELRKEREEKERVENGPELIGDIINRLKEIRIPGQINGVISQ